VIPARIVTDAVVGFCSDILEPLGIQVGDGKAPDGFGTPFMVVYRIASGFRADGGSWAQPGDIQTFKYQISGIGADRSEAEGLCDAVSIPWIEFDPAGGYVHELEVTGYTVLSRTLSTDVGLASEGVFTSIRHIQLAVS
jgi:hypothetical protein